MTDDDQRAAVQQAAERLIWDLDACGVPPDQKDSDTLTVARFALAALPVLAAAELIARRGSVDGRVVYVDWDDWDTIRAALAAHRATAPDRQP